MLPRTVHRWPLRCRGGLINRYQPAPLTGASPYYKAGEHVATAAQSILC
ncbi:hypothetical protein APY04_2315 [Hyphomicrobium sulfonivorans]|uniref:Uncharacterized protein n=1 Tax=Hyphomicrobium sulfonivorans TaxID=121290 RepID=A0A109BDR6_HYPSL|nr:hypothetical protein APY04_2315 [Hyphomicrobium sulfonivorans]